MYKKRLEYPRLTEKIEKRKYDKPLLRKEKIMNFPLEIIMQGRKIVCRQCSSCHNCR